MIKNRSPSPWKTNCTYRLLTPVSLLALPFFFCLFFCILIGCRSNVPQMWTILNFLDKFESCLPVFTSVHHFVKCHANHVNKVLVLIGWHLPTQVCQSFIRQTRVYQHKKVREKVGKNRSKFYLSPTVCQLVCCLFLCRSLTPTWVCQLKFAMWRPLKALQWAMCWPSKCMHVKAISLGLLSRIQLNHYL